MEIRIDLIGSFKLEIIDSSEDKRKQQTTNHDLFFSQVILPRHHLPASVRMRKRKAQSGVLRKHEACSFYKNYCVVSKFESPAQVRALVAQW